MGCCSCIFGCVKGGINCVAKTVLMSLNGFFAAQGLTITVVASLALVATDAIGLDDSRGFWVSALVFGGVILITSVLGCCGACFKNKIMLIVYMVLLTLLIIGQIVMVSKAAGIKDDTTEEAVGKLNEYNPANINTTEQVDDYQNDYECCGVNNYTDWKNNPFLTKLGDLPNSCCKEGDDNCGKGFFNTPTPDVNKIYTNGCMEDIGFWGELVWGMMISVIIIQAILVVLAGCLSWKCGDDED